MPKRRAARRAAARRTRREAAGKVALACLALCLIASGLTWAGRGRLGARYAAAPNPVGPPAPPPQGGFSPANPSKEYVYAGGRLVATEEPVGTPPAAPTNLRDELHEYPLPSGGVGADYWLLRWDDNASNEAGYKIERRLLVNGEWTPWAAHATVGPDVTTFRYTEYAFRCDTEMFRVKATNGAGDSAYSNEFYSDIVGCSTTTVAPANLVATALTASSVSLTWASPAGTVDHYKVERRGGQSAQFTHLSTSTAAAFTDNSVSPDTAYLYRVRAVFAGGGSSNYSNTDLATTVVFTDAELPGAPIKATHLVELRRAVNAVRALAGGLGPASWAYPDPVSSPASQRRPVYLEDVTDLRARLDEALGPLGLQIPYPPSPALARYAPIYGAHFEQIRARVK